MTEVSGPMPDRRRPPAVADLQAAIRREIVSLRLKPGARLSENELALRFGTSRTPVREAFIRLAVEGLVEVRPQRGTYVSLIVWRDVRRAAFTRSALECAIVRAAAETGLSRDALRRCEAALAAQAANTADPEAFTRADDAFHAAFAAAIGQADVWDLIDREKLPLERLRYLDVDQMTDPDTIMMQHRAVLDAVVCGEGDAAATLMDRHIAGVLCIADRVAARFPAFVR